MFAVMSAAMHVVVSPQTHVIRLDRNRFMPSQIRAHVGDTLRFVNGEGGPHNIEFERDSIAPAARTLIDRALGPKRINPLVGPMLILFNETYTFIVPDLPAGRYPFLCGPHYGNMRGVLIVDR
jgi:plastocyanin